MAAATLVAPVLAACGTAKGAIYEDGTLSMAVIATYGTGTSTYADVAAVANSLTNEKGVNTRIITSDTAIGRMTPLRSGQATFARTGDEYIYAFEGQHEFSSADWGPQQTRVVWGPIAPHGLLVKESSSITTPEDLKGKKVPKVTANPSVNDKVAAFLATGGLTYDDVRPVAIGYGEQADALKSGKIDVLFQQVYGSSLFELESSTPVQWVEFEPEGEKVIQRTSPSVELGPFTGAPGQAKGESNLGMVYSIPIVTYAKTEDGAAYDLARGIVDTYPDYKEATATTPDWGMDSAMIAPIQVPFHEGLITLLKEEGKWTPQAQKRQDELLAREKLLAKGWKSVTADTPDEQVPQAWAAWRKENLDD